ncbi:hypothetical protein LHYA1_G006037 [Lachnellula hyalina]|uniref:GEgh 16 protein n=1 Tax=Lachnellula hyalina TaxID=1316788 RepID=A0A8H8QZT5_9HELO|nr:uncharacterized protein LHYA1_G006037 [Lachnellula hyalina]TVY25175.1 hypothetical protein LHYA1_G006037 [Lachnellula hyalina]
MPSLIHLLPLLALVHAQGVILSAQGSSGSPASLPLQVLLNQADANVINQAEIAGNVVNECGRTLLSGNIDIGENTETQLANKTVTSVTKGGNVDVTISPGGANGAGPYTCDVDPTSNADGVSGQLNVTVKETDSTGSIKLALTMPSDLACVGASTGNICTVRCFNAAANGPFGGCFAVQQTDVTPAVNTPDNIQTAQTLAGINEQVAENQKDLPAAITGNQEATSGTEQEQGVLAVDNLLNIDSTASATAAIAAVSTAASAAASTGKAKGSGTGAKGAAGAAAGAGTGKGAANGATAKGAGNAAAGNAAAGNAAAGKAKGAGAATAQGAKGGKAARAFMA